MTSFGYRLNPRFAIKECSSCGALYTGDFCCSKENVEDKILVPKPPKNCARCAKCGHPNIFESFDDSTNVVNAPGEPFVVKKDHGVNPPHIDECCCECGNALDGIYCQQCICKSCGKGAHTGYNCPPKVPIISNLEPCNQTMNNELPQTSPSFDPTCYSDKENSKQEEKRIEEEQAAKARYWKIPACCNDDDDYDSAITPVLSTEETKNSLSMGDEHLDTIPATESDEVIKSNVEDLVPIPSESEGIPDTMCDVHLINNSTPLEAKNHFEIVTKSNNDISSSDDDSLYNKNIEYVEASPHDYELVSLEATEIVIPEEEEIEDDNLQFENFCFDLEEISSGNTTTHSDISLSDYEAFYFDDDHIEEISSGSTTTHSGISLSKYDSFIFDFTHEEFVDELTYIISPPEYDRFYFWNLPDPGITINRVYSFNPGLSHRYGAFKKFNTHRSHLNEWPMIINGKNIPNLDVLLFHFYPP
nr:hypothetical protein [Tanacetum cinerariifolium]